MPYTILIAPFADFEFMRRALVGVLALALGARRRRVTTSTSHPQATQLLAGRP